ncbi:MAG: sodium:proton antiporter [Bacilli bacterium]|nr:sodium:proton antiporter [Bacilli bacterium]
MNIFFEIMFIIVIIIGSNILYMIFNKIPLFIYQILGGLLLSLLPMFNNYIVENETFLLLIIAPLLFNDGQNNNFKEVSQKIKSTVSITVTLIIIMIIVMGLFIHLILPMIPLSLAFMIAAIISPTDAIAFNSITSDLILPKNIRALLEHESLFNDASGFVFMSLALSAFETGRFTISHSIGSFLFVSLGGLFCGLILGILAIAFNIYLRNKSVDENGVLVPLNLLTPFFIFLVAEMFHVSGIIAVVVAGLVHAVEKDKLMLISSRLKVVTSSLWDVLSKLLSGYVFVLLGLLLPNIFKGLNYNLSNLILLFLVALGCYIIMLLLRFFWVYNNPTKIQLEDGNSKQEAIIFALGGIHGTISLSLALAIPLSLSEHGFMYRDNLIIIVAFLVIISLIVPTIVLKRLLITNNNSINYNELKDAQNKMINYTIDCLLKDDNHGEEMKHIIDIIQSQKGIFVEHDHKAVNSLMNKTSNLEKTKLNALVASGKFSQSEYLHYEAMINRLSENRTMLNFLFSFLRHLTYFYRKQQLKRVEKKIKHVDLYNHISIRSKVYLEMENIGYQEVMTYLDQILNADNIANVKIVKYWYEQRHHRFVVNDKEDYDIDIELLENAFQYEFVWIQNQLNIKNIKPLLAKELYEEISNAKLMMMQTLIGNDYDY